MTIPDFLARLAAAGVSVTLQPDGHAVCDGPAAVLTPDLRAAVERHAPAMRAALVAECGELPARGCYGCGARAWWSAGRLAWRCVACTPPAPGVKVRARLAPSGELLTGPAAAVPWVPARKTGIVPGRGACTWVGEVPDPAPNLAVPGPVRQVPAAPVSSPVASDNGKGAAGREAMPLAPGVSSGDREKAAPPEAADLAPVAGSQAVRAAHAKSGAALAPGVPRPRRGPPATAPDLFAGRDAA